MSSDGAGLQRPPPDASSSSGGPSILRGGTRKMAGTSSSAPGGGGGRRQRGVSFARPPRQRLPSSTSPPLPSRRRRAANDDIDDGDGYDSDDLYDASAAGSGSDLLAAVGTGADATGDAEERRRVRREVDRAKQRRRRRRDGDDDGGGGSDDDEYDEDDNLDGGRSDRERTIGGEIGGRTGDGGSNDDAFRGEEDAPSSLSLIATKDSDGQDGQLNAGDNADCPVEPFNLRSEREGGGGYFDGDTYVFRREREGEEDAWLDGLDEREREGMARTAFASSSSSPSSGPPSQLRSKERSGGGRPSPSHVPEEMPLEDLCRRIARLLERDGETVAGALRRYGDAMRQGTTRNGAKKKKKRKQDQDDGDDKDEGKFGNKEKDGRKVETDARSETAASALAELTDLADALLFSGEAEAYDLTQADLFRRAGLEKEGDGGNEGAGSESASAGKRKRSYFDDGAIAAATTRATNQAGTTSAKCSGKKTVQWEYRGNEDNAVHGPFGTEQMIGWVKAGYFVGAQAVDVRMVPCEAGNLGVDGGGNKIQKKEEGVDDLMADLMESDDENEGKEKSAGRGNGTGGEQEWMRSDVVDFPSYL